MFACQHLQGSILRSRSNTKTKKQTTITRTRKRKRSETNTETANVCILPPAGFHPTEQGHLCPSAPFFLVIARLLVFGCIEPTVCLWRQKVRSGILKVLIFCKFELNVCKRKSGTWLERRKTDANPPEPSFFTILYSSFTLSTMWFRWFNIWFILWAHQKLRYESSTLILYKELSSSIFQMWVSQSVRHR